MTDANLIANILRGDPDTMNRIADIYGAVARPAKALSRAAHDVPPAPSKSAANVLARHAEDLRQLPIADALFVKAARALNIKRGRVVVPLVRALLHHLEIARAIVRLLLVPMMNVLGRQQFSPQLALHHSPVLVDLLPVRANDAIASYVQPMNVLPGDVTCAAAKRPLFGAVSPPAPEKSPAARRAFVRNFHPRKMPCPYHRSKATADALRGSP